jgi:signal transduction histidine kinase
MIEEKGLIGAIKSMLSEGAPATLTIRFKADVAFRRLDARLETGIYRIVQEAVTNIKRHSKAERAEVRLAQIADRLDILIRDAGVGFDPARVLERRFGLRGICERARLLGGSARVDSQPGKGTRIAVSLPLTGPPETT